MRLNSLAPVLLLLWPTLWALLLSEDIYTDGRLDLKIWGNLPRSGGFGELLLYMGVNSFVDAINQEFKIDLYELYDEEDTILDTYEELIDLICNNYKIN